MAAKPDTSGYERFSEVTDRLDEIIAAVRDKETSLERSLDLFDEAIALGTRAVDLVDKAAFSPEEKERLVSGPEQAEDAKANGGEAEQSAQAADATERSAGSDAADASDAERTDDGATQQPQAGDDSAEGDASVSAESGDTSKQA